jgi:hypothetical protein
MPIPEEGTVADGRYSSKYFDLSYPLPQGWTAGLSGPEPSDTGYYVLNSFVPADEHSAIVMIAAQDMFFALKPYTSVVAAATDFRETMAHIDGMAIDQDPVEVKIAGHTMQRVDFNGVGLYRATFLTEIRCHFVSFNLTARSPERLADLVGTLGQLANAHEEHKAAPVPVCIKDYAVPENVLHQVQPTPADPKFAPIPVRIVIDRDGGVRQVHVIYGSPQQRRNIEEALWQWKFKPPRVNDESVEVETGLLFRFAAPQT